MLELAGRGAAEVATKPDLRWRAAMEAGGELGRPAGAGGKRSPGRDAELELVHVRLVRLDSRHPAGSPGTYKGTPRPSEAQATAQDDDPEVCATVTVLSNQEDPISWFVLGLSGVQKTFGESRSRVEFQAEAEAAEDSGGGGHCWRKLLEPWAASAQLWRGQQGSCAGARVSSGQVCCCGARIWHAWCNAGASGKRGC
ncbi:hypothetical protein Taro_029883 [Colocasia esculenta]|uniref:Uncharacterized protein n=1 Tax=Colocasia esculenta TaxID=4460 RepID=A0A843VMI3_COLES|nr:hypothetical protein [Colocasia esculenta]